MSDLLTQLAPKLRHDLRGPLINLRLGLQLLEVGEENQEILESLFQEVDKAESLVNKLVDLAAAESPKLATVRMGAVVHQFASEREVHLGLVEESIVETDADLSLKLLGYLLENAHQAGAKMVRVSLTEGEGQVRLTMEDDGEGISAEILPKVSEPGFSTRALNGLGLAIAAAFARSHGGRLELSLSELGGAKVEVVLPGGPA